MGNACYYSVEKLLSSSLLSKNLKVRIYKTVILPVLLYGCETWTLTLREEHRFRVFENKVLRKIFGAKRDEVTGEWRKLHNTELHALYSSPDIIRNIKSRRLRWAGHIMGESRNAYRVLVGRPEGKRPLGRPRRRWEDNIKMDLREVGYDDRDWINLAQDRDRWWAYVRAAMNLRKGLPALPMSPELEEMTALSHMSLLLSPGIAYGVQMSAFLMKNVLHVYFRIQNRSYARVVDEFRRNYPDVTMSNNSTITRLIARFRECGSALLDNDERDCWFQQDSAPCHTSNETMQFLRESFGECIISQGLWPPRSPDFTSPDFFLTFMMPPVISRPSKGKWHPDSMKQAVENVLTGQRSIRKAAEIYNIPKNTSIDRVSAVKRGKEITFTPALDRFKPTFNAEFEGILLNHVKDLSDRLLPLTREEFLNVAFQLAEALKIPHQFSMTKRLLQDSAPCHTSNETMQFLRERNAVILSDSKAAILSIVSKHTPSSQTAEVTKMLSQLISLNKRIVFQWIPSHCGILGNENADSLAKGSTATYRPVTKSTYYSVKRFIKSTYLDFNKQNLITQSQGKKWNSLHQNPQLIPDLRRKSSVAAFRLATGHDCFAKHLHRIGIYQSPNCPLCNSNQEMDSEHLKICASVAGHDNIFEKYWSARGQMTLLSNAWH
ncbi:hypothetical protein ANN_12056 [Periplaneta americana]|uniref:RNase H type-1 domain-containing protein n=1 Tax=Periplaneta americana TaxID=6978 RepID=A0ABQ8T8L2_PERAM|nr:hypothetical protein ANN_12056 [Periplaneta americana]